MRLWNKEIIAMVTQTLNYFFRILLLLIMLINLFLMFFFNSYLVLQITIFYSLYIYKIKNNSVTLHSEFCSFFLKHIRFISRGGSNLFFSVFQLKCFSTILYFVKYSAILQFLPIYTTHPCIKIWVCLVFFLLPVVIP